MASNTQRINPSGVPLDPDDNDLNVVAIWLRKDPKRWVAGILAGILAGAVAAAVAGVLATMGGRQFLFPVKLLATPILGATATNLAAGPGMILVGVLMWEGIAAFFGFVFAHFTGTNSLSALLPMGLVWSAFSWVFLFNLFFQSWKTIYAAQISPGVAIPICLAYGLSLSSVAFFDRMLR